MSVLQRICAPINRQLTQLTSRTFSTLQQCCVKQGAGHMQSTHSSRQGTSQFSQISGSNFSTSLFSRCMATLSCMHRSGPRWKKKAPRSAVLEGAPQKRGVVIKVMIKKPKKPNSANRKCVRVRLTNGQEATAYVPGEGHNLQEHSIVLCRGGRLKDVPGVRLKCVRGKYDLAHVKKKVM
ncbi:40S ribosomal protein S12, mitochondrial-like [Mercenaria mercenaria]|uniref:40S ribosomal protein S12, mitochondrial-like n=1 Tax=Mercenaria mercenaria TaxID=6596 RepID=UPI001E1D575A|nr:40S ribosomal protein S12, mitochondrial-like [Mercenaria mercenaria]